MGLDQLGVWAHLSQRRVDTPCFTAPCLSFPPGVESHRSSLAPQGDNIRAYPMQHVVNKAHTRSLAANLISGHPIHAGNHRHGTARHNLGRGRTPKAADVQVFGKAIPMAGGC